QGRLQGPFQYLFLCVNIIHKSSAGTDQIADFRYQAEIAVKLRPTPSGGESNLLSRVRGSVQSRQRKRRNFFSGIQQSAVHIKGNQLILAHGFTVLLLFFLMDVSDRFLLFYALFESGSSGPSVLFRPFRSVPAVPFFSC